MIPVLVDAGYRVIAMDHLGMGRSDKPTNIEYYSYLRHADRMERFIEQLDLRDITLFVQDWGSLVGLRVAGLNLDRFARISLGNGDLPNVPAEDAFDFGIDDPDVVEDIPYPYRNMPAQQPEFYDGCELIQETVVEVFGTDGFDAWVLYAMKGASFTAGEVVESQSYFDVPDDEIAAYDAPFPSRIYMGGPRTFPSLAQELAGVNEEAAAELFAFTRPFLTLFGTNDPANLGRCENQDRFICDIPGAAGQPHARIPQAAHYLQDDQGEEVARRMVAWMQEDRSITGNHTADCAPDQEPLGGFGNACEADTDCSGQEANACLIIPGQEGFCTIEGCAAGSCGEPFLCCRECAPEAAAQLPFEESACLPQEAAGQLIAGAGCTCD